MSDVERVNDAIPVTYDDFVSMLSQYHIDFSPEDAVELLRKLGMKVDGELRAYWPVDSAFILDCVSGPAADVVERLLSDERFRVVPMPAERRFESEGPRRKLADGYQSASLYANGRPRIYKFDRHFPVRFFSHSYELRTPENWTKPISAYHYVNDIHG